MYYKAEVKNFEALMQRIVTEYLKYGYFYMKAGWIREEVLTKQFDRETVQKFDITYRNRHGSQDVQYVRFGTYYLLVSRRKHRLTNEGVRGVIDIRENYVSLNHKRMCIKKNALLVEDGDNKQWYKLKPSHGFKDFHDKPKHPLYYTKEAPVEK
ncbi:hypothetical protein DSM106972_052970 [Dulcicalothrix desertica PCC 7102]|uniref:Uncharacterized protein n=1 Tax=Dulcicalothrix desertica PCC 7102 TaxID=232991 RepID=A0A3S1ALN5_9CYAN|nr:hypothetical protein [Dulcicalothrix desertica]RUT03658.1 hypothetical protein DSM106972_052970 [Dulcicalothrix desertica PCC 7102]TWH43902.1 hypothetical protein CAL7102_07654 [Dulcicalothrix desertica PCC 7102]